MFISIFSTLIKSLLTQFVIKMRRLERQKINNTLRRGFWTHKTIWSYRRGVIFLYPPEFRKRKKNLSHQEILMGFLEHKSPGVSFLMNCISFNIRGIGGSTQYISLKHFIMENKADIYLFQKTMNLGVKACEFFLRI